MLNDKFIGKNNNIYNTNFFKISELLDLININIVNNNPNNFIYNNANLINIKRQLI